MTEDLREKPESYWREKLTPAQYNVCRLKGTERPFSGELYYNQESGVYQCVACGEELFTSDDKFDAHCGWPSFDRAIAEGKIEERRDNSIFFMPRTEVLCKRCGSHLGHVFDDGPRETTGMRYCINSISLKFQKKASQQQEG